MSAKKRSYPIDEAAIPEVGVVRAGRVLQHPIFGLGEIKQIAQWESGDITIAIDFIHHGLKWLVPEVAMLAVPEESI